MNGPERKETSEMGAGSEMTFSAPKGEHLMEWKTIDSAPRDGTEILGFWQYTYPGDSAKTCGQRVIAWDREWNGWHDDEGETHVYGAENNRGIFTHWTELPPPPVNVKEEG